MAWCGPTAPSATGSVWAETGWERAPGRLQLLEQRLEAWDERPVLAYGFEDMTTAQVRALLALAARVDVTVSLPYEVGRPAYAAVSPLVEALSSSSPEVIELPPGCTFRLARAGAPRAHAVHRRAGSAAPGRGRIGRVPGGGGSQAAWPSWSPPRCSR